MPKKRAIPLDAWISNKTTYGLVLSAVVLAVTPSISALQLGELQVKSSLGSPFSASIPVRLKDDEPFDASCVHLLPEGKQEASYLRQANISVSRGKGSTSINIQTKYRLDEPLLRLAISVNCAGSSTVSRDYPVLLDPPLVNESSKLASSALVVVPPLTTPRFSGKKWITRAGDSPNSLAQALYPNDAQAQAKFVQQLLARYPDIQSADEVIEPSRPIYLPKVRPTNAVSALVAKTPKANLSPTVKKVEAANPPVTATTMPANTDRLELSSAEPIAESGLKLSYTLAPSTKNLNEAEKEALRQKLKLINSDDQLAYLIDLQSQLKQVHQEMEGLKKGAGVAAIPTSVEPITSGETQVSRWLDSPYWLPGLAGLGLFGLLGGGWWYYRRKQSVSQWSLDEFVPPASLMGAAEQVDHTPMPMSELSAGLSLTEDATKEFGPDIGHGSAIVVEESDRWAVEEAQVYLSHGWIDHAVSLLKEEIEKNQYHLDLWIMLFDILKQHHLSQEFDELAVRFKEIAFGLPIWDQVVAMQADLKREDVAPDTAAETDAAHALDVALDLDLAVEQSAEAPVLPVGDYKASGNALSSDDQNILPFESVWLADEEPAAQSVPVPSDHSEDIFNLDFPQTDVPTLELDAPLSLVVGEAALDSDSSSMEVDFDLGNLSLSPMESSSDKVDAILSGTADELPEEIDYTNIDFDLTLDLPVEAEKKQ